MHHSNKSSSVALDAFTRRDERCVDRGSSRAGGIEDVACACLQGQGWVWLERLHHVELIVAQRFKIAGHGSIGHAVEPGRINSLLAQVVLQAHPRRGDFGNCSKSQ